ncbi:hypothetical protein DL768_004889 [Monosporascus sp. mg162]|nr:hypothetical protein DL768_004889 [Monosporascus sp. mg162]
MKVFAKLSSESKKDEYLDWKYFDFKLSEKDRLRGSDNWEMWKTAVWVALMTIGHRDGDSAKLTHIDEAKWAAALQFVKCDSKQSALHHVVDFKNLVRRRNDVEMPVNARQQVIIFINWIRDRDDAAGVAWKGRIRGMFVKTQP